MLMQNLYMMNIIAMYNCCRISAWYWRRL